MSESDIFLFVFKLFRCSFMNSILFMNDYGDIISIHLQCAQIQKFASLIILHSIASLDRFFCSFHTIGSKSKT